MWVLSALLSSVSAGISVIFQKKGTFGDRIFFTSALNVCAMFFTIFAVTAIGGSFSELYLITPHCLVLTVLSGIFQALSWIFYFLALRDADVNYMMVLDKFNIVVTMLLAWLIVGETITPVMLLASAFILGGTAVMVDPAEASLCGGSNRWIIWGLVSPTLQAVSNILAKLDSTPVSVSLTTCIRVLVVALVLSIIAIIKEGSGLKLQHQDKGKLLYLILGGCILGVSYLLMYSAIYSGIAAVVTPIVKSNIIVTTVLANIFLDERLSRRGWAGFAIVCAGLVFFLF